mmetsp:Transcript_6841/g.16786  ORF Transcript_6841/g.16786 Transcript_6841/m.16786 type:complete len:317 (-) Transcript_6841:111-1061(-)|eukprot:CAMPEP_0197188226 /NCGR_PEP_ID=MMETSP1423-20130617/17483_1 /TAXON_ID=476441 /ORGANISM="Pseudo-nitzschia heimii, Strain UNC1101" /LENGTH=316 /DNA_ID=CAMNT_0042640013 /DNA_START=84 /DNA_END=1034 /DNA_ORIENTATION=+
MSSSLSTEQKPKNSKTPRYKKILEGISTNKFLLELWKETYSKNVPDGSATDATDTETSSLPNAAPNSEDEAIEILRKTGDPSKLKKRGKDSIVMPIRVLQSIHLLLSPSARESLDDALDKNKNEISLIYTPPYKPEMTEARKKHLARMDTLRLKSEETKYTRITKNIKDQRQEDDKTARSMTYAASVGINMIVAPISFGTFMYFFSGGVFDYILPPSDDDDDRPNQNPTGVDIKRVIVGVVSGVIMMIIEMVLFVIRSHEFDAYTTKKKKKRGVQPFGAYSANSAMTYTDSASIGNLGKPTTTPQSKEDLAAKKMK